MDKTTLISRLAAFEELGRLENRSFTIVRLDDAIPGIATGSFIVRLLAPWVGKDEREDTYGILTDILWRSTDLDTRRAVAALSARATADEIVSEAQAQAVWSE